MVRLRPDSSAREDSEDQGAGPPGYPEPWTL